MRLYICSKKPIPKKSKQEIICNNFFNKLFPVKKPLYF